MNYNHTPEARMVSQKYSDIIHSPRPEPSCKHPRMTLSNRAKIFSPFAALRGFDEEINEESLNQLHVTKTELSDEDKTALSDKLSQVRKGMKISVTCFSPCSDNLSVGNYRTLVGTVENIDPIYHVLRIHTEEKVPSGKKQIPVTIKFDDILDLC